MQTLFLPNLAEGANIQQDLVYTFKRAIQERSSSYQNLAQATDESARPRQQDSKCKLKAFKLLPKPCTGIRKRQDHVYIIQPCKPLGPCQSLAEGADESARPRLHRSKTCKSRALRLLQTLQRERKSQQDHVHVIQTCKLLDPCQTLLRERRDSKTTTTSFKTCKSRALRLLQNPCKGSE